MKDEIFDNLPALGRKELIELRQYCKSILQENNDIIYQVEIDSVLYEFKDNTNSYALNITFIEYQEVEQKIIYKIFFAPQNSFSLKGTSVKGAFRDVKICIVNWINYIKELYSLSDSYYDQYAQFYENEFQDFFVNNDEDASINPFDVERQEIIYYFLTFAEREIANSNEIDEPTKVQLISEISILKNDIPTSTKKELVSALSKFAKHTKKFSNKLFHDVFDVLKKEAIKKLLYYGADQLPGLLNDVQQWALTLLR